MTFALRQLHRRIFGWLTWVLPAIFIGGLLGYRGPVSTTIPDPELLTLPASAEPEPGKAGIAECEAIERTVPVRVEIFREPIAGSAGGARRWVRVISPKSLRQPDLLVYWSSRSSAFDEPPPGAFLLGVLDPRTPQVFRLPPQSDFLQGYLAIYSLGQRVLISQVPLPPA